MVHGVKTDKQSKVGSLITKENRRRSPTKAGREICITSFVISDPTLVFHFRFSVAKATLEIALSVRLLVMLVTLYHQST